MDRAEPDVLADRTLPREHRSKLPSTNLLERLNGEIKRRTNVAGVRPLPRTGGGRASLPNDAAITWLVGAILLEQNDEWAVRRAHTMTPETIAQTGQCWPTEPGFAPLTDVIDRASVSTTSFDGPLRGVKLKL